MCESMFIPIEKRTLILKNGGKKSFSYKTKASISFIPIRKMSLHCPIIKKKQIIMRISVCPKWLINFNSKNGGRISFSYETKASMSFIPMSKTSLWGPNMKRKKIIMWIYVCPSWQTNFDFEKWLKEKPCLWSQSINAIYTNKENEFMVPNNEKKGDYYVK